MSEILYNFLSNNSSLSDITSNIQGLQEVRQDIDGIFQTLMTVYEGDGATSLNQAHVKISNMLDEALHTIAQTQNKAQDQQDSMQALDRANAAAF